MVKKVFILIQRNGVHISRTKRLGSTSSISFDYAILEKEFKKIVVQLDIKWSDLGTFESIYKIKKTIGNVKVLILKTALLFLTIESLLQMT